MARYTGPRVRVSRRIGFNVFENRKGDKALQDRPYPPGENGKKRMRETDYGTQLKEKQKVRYMYGVMEKQFRNYYKEATRMPGITGENLLVLLESRIDNVLVGNLFLKITKSTIINNNKVGNSFNNLRFFAEMVEEPFCNEYMIL